jgi:hypothetical protein
MGRNDASAYLQSLRYSAHNYDTEGAAMIQSTMTRLREENDRWRKNGKIDRIVCWSCIAIVIGFQAYKLFKGMP